MSLPARYAMSHAEIAKKLGISVQAVRWAEQSARRKLREHPEIGDELMLLIWDGTHDLRPPAPR
jgi:DNA-directed RNA polymerase sigma subunit (sigma70/sigma32)